MIKLYQLSNKMTFHIKLKMLKKTKYKYAD